MHHASLKQKLGGPEAHSSSHKGHGCHSKGRPHKTPAARESTLAKAGRGLGLQGASASVPSPSLIVRALRWALLPTQHPLRPLQVPPPCWYSGFVFLPPLGPALPSLKGPHPTPHSSEAPLLPPPSSGHPPSASWFCNKHLGSGRAPHVGKS